MPQIFQVLKCYKCLVFQVHQTKKSNRFSCKMCGEKQSIKRHYGVGNGQECRMHVQKLNSVKGELDETRLANKYSDQVIVENENGINPSKKNSKWTEFVSDKDVIENKIAQDKMFLDDTEVVLELPNRKRQRKSNSRFKKCLNGFENFEHSKAIKEDADIENKTVTRVSLDVNDSANVLYSSNATFTNCLHNANGAIERTINNDKKNFDVTDKSDPHRNNVICKQNILRTKFFVPIVNENSKWVKFEPSTLNESTEKSEISEESDIDKYVFAKPEESINVTIINCEDKYNFDPKHNDKNEIEENNIQNPKANYENSKWTNYIDESKDDNEHSELESSSQKNRQSLFSLCADDEELDSYLDI